MSATLRPLCDPTERGCRIDHRKRRVGIASGIACHQCVAAAGLGGGRADGILEVRPCQGERSSHDVVVDLRNRIDADEARSPRGRRRRREPSPTDRRWSSHREPGSSRRPHRVQLQPTTPPRHRHQADDQGSRRGRRSNRAEGASPVFPADVPLVRIGRHTTSRSPKHPENGRLSVRVGRLREQGEVARSTRRDTEVPCAAA